MGVYSIGIWFEGPTHFRSSFTIATVADNLCYALTICMPTCTSQRLPQPPPFICKITNKNNFFLLKIENIQTERYQNRKYTDAGSKSDVGRMGLGPIIILRMEPN